MGFLGQATREEVVERKLEAGGVVLRAHRLLAGREVRLDVAKRLLDAFDQRMPDS